MSKRLGQCTEALDSDIKKMNQTEETSAKSIIDTIRKAAEEAEAYNSAMFADTITALRNAAEVIAD